MNALLDEVRRMHAGSVGLANKVGWVKVPTHLVWLREYVLTKRRGRLVRLHRTLDEHLGTTGPSDDYMNVFYAASRLTGHEHRAA